MPKIFYNLQALRFFAALSVATFHTEIFYRRAGGTWTVDPLRIGFARIDLFFVISGFVTTHVGGSMTEPRQAFRFLYRRFARIFTNYWPAMLAMLLIMGIFMPGALFGYDYLRGIFLIDVPARVRILPVTWTLSRELAFYMLFAGACLAPRRLLPWLVLAFMALMATSWFRGWPSWPRFVLSPLTLEFMIGVAVRLLLPHLGFRKGNVVFFCACVAGLFGAAYLYRQFESSLLTRALIVGPAAGLLVFAAANAETDGKIVKPWLSSLGNYAYSIYLVHWPLLTLVGFTLQPFVRAHPWSAEWVYGSIPAVAVLYAVLNYRYVELPLYRLATRPLKTQAVASPSPLPAPAA